MSNKCGTGFCSKGFDSARVAECRAGMDSPNRRELWNGQCAFQDGNLIDDEVEQLVLHCCTTGCTMSREQYAVWNKLCAHAGRKPRRRDVSSCTEETFEALSARLVAEGFVVDHYHAVDRDEQFDVDLVVHIGTDGEVSGGDINSLLWKVVTPRDWHRLVADEWHEMTRRQSLAGM